MTTIKMSKMSKISRNQIALVLAIISFLMLLLPWINVSIEVFGREYSIPDVVDLICYNEEIPATQVDLAIQVALSEFAEEVADDTGVVINTKDAANAVNKLLKGKWSLLDAATLTTYVGGVLKDIEQAINLSVYDMSYSERTVMMVISELSSTINTAAVVLWLIIVLLVGTFVFAIVTLRNHNKTGIIAYAIAVAVPVIAVWIAVGRTNNTLATYASYITDLIEDYLWDLGSFGIQNLKLVHVSAAPFVALMCAIAAVVTLVLSKGGKICGVDIPAVPNFKWTCACGVQNSLSNAFCSACGSKRPEKPRCECGAAIVPGTKFCGKCGKIVEIVADVAPVVPVEPVRRCPKCGSIMDGGVCKRCMDVIPQTRKCIRCGAPVYGNNTVCETCSTSGSRLSGDLWSKLGDSELE